MEDDGDLVAADDDDGQLGGYDDDDVVADDDDVQDADADGVAAAGGDLRYVGLDPPSEEFHVVADREDVVLAHGDGGAPVKVSLSDHVVVVGGDEKVEEGEFGLVPEQGGHENVEVYESWGVSVEDEKQLVGQDAR